MSRICVKGLSKLTTEKDLLELFSQKGEVTDCKILRTSSGISRRFAFIGFKTASQANDAMKYFNNSYLYTSKIHIELATKLEIVETQKNKGQNKKETQEIIQNSSHNDKQESLIATLKQAKSRHSKKKLDKILKMLEQEDQSHLEKDRNTKDDKKVSTHSQENKREQQHDEFLQVMQSRNSRKNWGNDDVVYQTGANDTTTNDDKDSKTDDESDAESEDYNFVDEDLSLQHENDTTQNSKGLLSDLDFLKSKMKSSSFSDSEDESQSEIKQNSPQKPITKSIPAAGDAKIDASLDIQALDNEDMDDSGRLFIRNLSFTATEDDVKQLFEEFGPITEIHIPLDSTKKAKGFGFVQFMIPEHAQTAITKTDGTSFQGRLLHVLNAKAPKMTSNEIKTDSKLSSFQQKKEEERRKMLHKKDGWNAAYVRSDTVIDSIAERYGIKQSDILDSNENAGEMAVRLAMAETQIIQENREYLATHGVDTSILESNYSTNKNTLRSTTTLLVKNLPFDMVPEELEEMFSKFGDIGSFLVPKSKTIAIVDFIEPSEARLAHKSLAYRRYHKVPLYLEWAPVNLLNKEKASKSSKSNKTTAIAATSVFNSDPIQVDNENEYSTLFIKNLNFQTTEETLHSFVKKLDIQGLRAVSIQKKPSTTSSSFISMGFGFMEFQSSYYANIAETKLNNLVIDGHSLEVKPSNKRITKISTSFSSKESNDKDKTNMKVVVRNVPFQATTSEIRALFNPFGNVKSVRIPKKMGSNHRGFAFVEFTTHQEAVSAMSSLSNTHFYGRHLVLEWANTNDDDLEVLRKKAKIDEKVLKVDKKRRLNDYEGIDSGYQDNKANTISIGQEYSADFDDMEDDYEE